MPDPCPVCNSDLKEKVPGYDATIFSCPLCGKFALSGSLIATLPYVLQTNKDASPKISHALRTIQAIDKSVELNRYTALNTYTINEIVKRPLPTPREQADLFIRWLAENVRGPGETVWVEPATHRSIIGAKSQEGFALILRYLFEVGLVEGNLSETMGAPGRAHVTLSFKGWDYYEQLRRGGVTYRKGFIAMKFGDPMLDKLLAEILKPSVKQAGFELYRLDDTPKAGLIDDRLRVEIQSSDFLIADLTHDNPGAYWEAGYAEGLGKPVIYICEKEKFETTKTHFDTNHHLTIVWDKDALQKAGVDLKATIRATSPHLAKQEDETA
ncbi:MAG: hypothetical protein FJ130_06725 [Deltaproteobacteria bacterium]|nr:hypothetical protein [Deltaproteobacteria bacterium]